MKGFYKIYTVQFYNAVTDVSTVQVFTQESRAMDYFKGLQKDLLNTRIYASQIQSGSCFEGYLPDNQGRDYLELKTWDLNKLPH